MSQITDQMLTVDERPAVRLERHYPHPVAKVWRAVSQAEHLSSWFPSPVEIELRPGGAIRFAAFAGDVAEHGRVLVVEPPHHLELAWGADRLIFELAPTPDGTTFTFVHVFDDRAAAASVAAGWHVCLAALRHVLADEPAPPHGSTIERHEQLVTEFGLDQPAVDRTADGWRIRFERQLTCPTAVAWDLIHGLDRHPGKRVPAVGEPLTAYESPEMVSGTVTELAERTERRVFAFDTASEQVRDHVRIELADGTGQGARLIVTVTGRVPTEPCAVIREWGGAVERIARRAAGWALQST